MSENFIAELSRDLQFPEEISPQSPGVYVLPLENNIDVKIAISHLGFRLDCTVIPVPTINREKFLSNVMHANLFGQGTRSGVLSLSEDGNLLTLSREVNYNVDYKVFRNTLEDFLSVVDLWRDEAKNHK